MKKTGMKRVTAKQQLEPTSSLGSPNSFGVTMYVGDFGNVDGNMLYPYFILSNADDFANLVLFNLEYLPWNELRALYLRPETSRS